MGVLFVNYRKSHRFTAEEQEDIQLLAHQAAVAIRAAQMRDRLEERAQMLHDLAKAARSISATFDVQKILELTVQTAVQITSAYGPDADIALVALEDDQEPETLVFRAAQPPEMLPGLMGGTRRIRLLGDDKRGITGRAFRTGGTQIVDDVRGDVDYIPVDPEIRSELAVPIQLGDRVLGVLDVESKELRAFDQQDREAMELLAAEAAVALENAYRYRELRETKGLVGQRTVLAFMGLADNMWRHSNQKQARTILETVQGVERTIRKFLASTGQDSPDPSAVERLGRQLARIREAASAIENKPALPRLNPDVVVPVDVAALARDRVAQLRRNPRYHVVQFGEPTFSAVHTRGQVAWLRQALELLVDNAVRAVQDRAKPRVMVSVAVEESAWVEIRVADNGPGLPPEVRDSLGCEFVYKPNTAEGLGIGLVLAQMILEAYGGRVRVVDTGPQGTVMALRLPIYSE